MPKKSLAPKAKELELAEQVKDTSAKDGVLLVRRKDCEAKFNKVQSELENRAKEWQAYERTMREELLKLQGEYRLLTEMIDGPDKPADQTKA